MNHLKIDPLTIDLKKALEMTLWNDYDADRRLTYKSNHFPKVIDFDDIAKVRPPKGFDVKLFSRDIKIETSSYRGVCPGAVHFYCHIRFDGLSLISGGYSVSGATGAHEGRIFGVQTIDVNRPVTAEDLADKYSDWTGYSVGDMTHRWYNTKNAIECARRIVELRFRNYGNIIAEDCDE